MSWSTFGMMVTMTEAPHRDITRWMEAWSGEEGALRATALMARRLGASARAVASAPGNLTIIGDYTDIGQGLGLPTVTAHRTFVAATSRDDRIVRVTMAAGTLDAVEDLVWEGTLDDVASLITEGAWYSYAAAAIWAMCERGYRSTGVDLAITSCIPLGSSLSPVSSLVAATTKALNEVWGLALATGEKGTELVDLCIEAENAVAGWGTAGLVQHSLIRCNPGEALHLDFGTSPTLARPCPLYFPDYGLAMLVIMTSASALGVGATVKARMDEVRAASAALGVKSLRELQDSPEGFARIESLTDEVLRRRARHVYTENERVDLVRDELSGTAPAHERFVAVGKAMYRSHASLELDFDVSTPELNLAVETAFRTGALGARLVGPGGGGSAVALVRRAAASSTAAAITRQFEDAGAPPPRFALV